MIRLAPSAARPWSRAVVLPVVVTMVSAVFAVAEPAGAVGPCDTPANEIVAENCLPGNPASEWEVAGAGDPSIQGFATDMSVDQGQTIDFKIDTTASSYRIDIYRLGYYGGSGARRVARIVTTATMETEQPDCLVIDGTTDDNLVDCGNWSVSASWSVPASATSGLYVARPRRLDNGGASHIAFVVRDDDGSSDLLFQTSDTTWQAYNSYGDNSLYAGPGHAHKVSYNRPFVTRGGPIEDWFFNAEYPMLRWLERNGYDVSYFSGIDTARRGDELLEHEAFMSVGHDEYWSAEQRDNVEAARDDGVDLAFFSGNEVYWKTRWEPSPVDGDDDRTLVAYKEGNTQGSVEHYNCFDNFACDPDPDTWTGLWRQNALGHDAGRPENSLSGQISWHDSTETLQVPSELDDLRFWRNTTVALTSGSDALAPDTLGYEWNPEQPAFGATDPDSRIWLTQTQAGGLTHHVSLYRAPSGALVFGAGTVQWTWGLDAIHDRGSQPENADMQQATVNLLSDMGAQPGSLQTNLFAGAPPDNAAPTAAITDPLDGASVPGGNVVISGTAADSGGVVAAVEVSTDGGTTWDRATGTTNWTHTINPPPGDGLIVQARAVDDAANIGAADSVNLDIGEQECPCSIFSPAVTGPEQNDNSAVELGVRFRSDVDGFITGIRFYKTSGNAGPHTGTLWSNSGVNMATVTFIGESGSGWQEATFNEPVAILPDTTYVASYHTTVGRYATGTSFATAGVDNPPLHALQAGVDGANGVYRYGAGGTFPEDTFAASNYLVDVVFEGEVVEPDAVVDDTPADFAAGVTGASTFVSDTAGDGEVVLAPTLRAEFEETALPAGWTSTLWAGGGPGGSTVGGGAVVIDGALLATDDSYGPGRSIEFDATFGAATFQHAGFGVDVNDVNRWAMFSTNNATGTVFARTNNAGAVSVVPLPGALIGSSHRYRIDWLSNAVVFSVDGVPLHTEPVAIVGDMRPIVSDFTAGGPAVSVDWMRVSPYVSSGTFMSRVLDAGVLVDWQTLAVTDSTPAGTAAGYEVRIGDTTDPDDGTWSAFTPIVDGGDVAGMSRYVQYRATLTTTDPAATPAVERVAIGHVTAPAGPTITGGIGSVVEGNEGTVELQVPVRLSAPSGATVRVNWTTAPTPGLIAGQDYDTASGTLVFAPGDTEELITITVHGDNIDELGVLFGAEWLFLVMSAPVNGAFGPGLFGAIAHGFITDDDPTPIITGGIGSVVEGDDGPIELQIPVRLSGPSGSTVTVNYTTVPSPGLVPGEDYLTETGTVTFAPGDTEEFVSITVLGDNTDEPGVLFGNEWLFINLTTPTNAVFGTGFFANYAHGFITDDD